MNGLKLLWGLVLDRRPFMFSLVLSPCHSLGRTSDVL